MDLLQLRDHRLDDLAAPVADIDAEEPGEAVDVLVAVRVPDVAPLPAYDDGRVRQTPALGELAHLREVQPDIVGNRTAHLGSFRHHQRGGRMMTIRRYIGRENGRHLLNWRRFLDELRWRLRFHASRWRVFLRDSAIYAFPSPTNPTAMLSCGVTSPRPTAST